MPDFILVPPRDFVSELHELVPEFRGLIRVEAYRSRLRIASNNRFRCICQVSRGFTSWKLEARFLPKGC